MGSREVRVREASPRDAESIHALAAELAEAVGDRHPERGAVRERLLELLDEPRAGVLVAEDGDGEVVGVASFWIKPDLGHGDTVAEVPMLVVAERARRGGTGRMLVDEVRERAAAEGAGLIELVATRQNETALEFYRSLGFVEADLVALEFVGDLRDPPENDDE